MSDLTNLALTVTHVREGVTLSIANGPVTCETTFPDTHVGFISGLDRLGDMYRKALDVSLEAEKQTLLTSIQTKISPDEWALVQRLL